MRKGYLIISMMVLVLVCLALSPAMAQAPNSITYQGRLVDGDGNVIGASTAVTFMLYSALTGGSPFYTQAKSVDPDDVTGVFTVELTGVDATDFNGSARYLEMSIGGQTLTPRQLITSVPYAYSAEYAENIPNNSVTSAKILDGTITGADISNGSIYDDDIGDEPGIARSKVSNVTIATSGVTNITSRAITAPTSGYVLAIAHYIGVLDGTTLGNMLVGIETSAATSPTVGEYTVFGYNNFNFGASGTHWGSCSSERLFSVSAGSNTFYLNATRGFTSGTASVSYVCMDLLFFPTLYGTVSTAPLQENEYPAATSDGEIQVIPVGIEK